MKRNDIKETMDQIEDYAAFYDNDNEEETIKDEKEEQEKLDQDLIGVFETEREKEFYEYADDLEFVRYHKRTTKNFQDGLQSILDSSKQTVAKGMLGKYQISVNQIRLNKSCTVGNVFWSLNAISPDLINNQWRSFQAHLEKDYLK